MDGLETCKTPGCNNTRDHNRRICNVCRNRQRGNAAKRERRKRLAPLGGKVKLGPCNPDCPEWRRCTDERLWLDRLPCETLLPFEELGIEYEEDSSPTVWRIPLMVMDAEAA